MGRTRINKRNQPELAYPRKPPKRRGVDDRLDTRRERHIQLWRNAHEAALLMLRRQLRNSGIEQEQSKKCKCGFDRSKRGERRKGKCIFEQKAAKIAKEMQIMKHGEMEEIQSGTEKA